MKLLITTDCFLPRWDGIVRFLMDILLSLEKEFQVKILAPDFGKLEKKFNIKRIKTIKKNFGDIQFAKFDRKTIKQEVSKSDFIFNQSIGPVGFLSILAAKKQGKKIISYIHTIEWELSSKALKTSLLKIISKLLVKKISRWIYNKTDLLILPSQNLADKLEWNGFKTKKKIIHMGVNTKKFKPALNKGELKKKLGLEGKYVIGYHGRIAREKDLLTLLRAFRRLNDKNSRLLIVGDGLEELKDKLERKNIILVGKQNNVIPYLNSMDVYVMPSLTETSCLAVMEAMSCSLPVISTPVGFVNDYIEDGKNSFFFPFKNSFFLYRKLKELKNYKLREKIGTNARRTILTKFEFENTKKEIVETIKEFSDF